MEEHIQDSIVHNVNNQTRLWKEMGFYEGKARAYREIADGLYEDISQQERNLDYILKGHNNPPF